MDIIIAVDTGNWAVKSASYVFGGDGTPHISAPFNPGLTRHGKKVPPLATGALSIDGQNYSITSAERLPVRRDKTNDEDYRILTLGAMAREIRDTWPKRSSYGTAEAPISVALAMGLPVAHLSVSSKDGESLRNKYKEFFGFEGKPIQYSFEGTDYHIQIDDVGVFPQSIAAVMAYPHIYAALRQTLRSYIIDIGGGTTNVIPIVAGKPQNPGLTIEDGGALELYKQCRRRAMEENGVELDEIMCDGILRGLQTVPVTLYDTLNECAGEFVRQLLHKLHASGVDLAISGLCFVGGTSVLLRSHIERELQRDDVNIINDISANAQGYLQLERGRLLSAG